jgi:hypothetical protein
MESIFHCPSDLMRLTMLTRDKVSLLLAVQNGQQERQHMDGNDRKERESREAGILPLNYSHSTSIINIAQSVPYTPRENGPA